MSPKCPSVPIITCFSQEADGRQAQAEQDLRGERVKQGDETGQAQEALQVQGQVQEEEALVASTADASGEGGVALDGRPPLNPVNRPAQLAPVVRLHLRWSRVAERATYPPS
eukprot:COSAG02_NODE_1281_length_13472_cov_8.763048_9_plen_112_part_00